MTFLRAVFDRLAPIEKSENGERKALQIERALAWIWLLAFLGVIVLAMLAVAQPKSMGLHYFALATLAALAAGGVGSALGLLFGLPSSSGRVMVITPPTVKDTTSKAETTPTSSNMPHPVNDWYRDNTSLEQVAQWLTTAIVALSLANFDNWTKLFDRLAQNLTCALETPPSTKIISCPETAIVPGGLILATYGIFGLLGGYLWSRRYLMQELAGARGDLIKSQHQISAEQEKIGQERAEAANLVQERLRAPTPVYAAAAAAGVSKAAAVGKTNITGDIAEKITKNMAEESSAPLSNLPFVLEGNNPDDPWKGQFSIKSSNVLAEIVAEVSERPSDPTFFQVDIRIRGINSQTRATLANQPLRLYLHPTFPDPIRNFHLDPTGELHLVLLAYGAFTIGVQFMDASKLELDLKTLPDAPAPFRLR